MIFIVRHVITVAFLEQKRVEMTDIGVATLFFREILTLSFLIKE